MAINIASLITLGTLLSSLECNCLVYHLLKFSNENQ